MAQALGNGGRAGRARLRYRMREAMRGRQLGDGGRGAAQIDEAKENTSAPARS
jgi:hypothetical protein